MQLGFFDFIAQPPRGKKKQTPKAQVELFRLPGVFKELGLELRVLRKAYRRSIRVQIYDRGEVRVQCGLSTPRREIEEYLSSLEPWLRKSWSKLEEKRTPIYRPKFLSGEELYHRGQGLPLVIESTSLARTRFELKEDRVLLQKGADFEVNFLNRPLEKESLLIGLLIKAQTKLAKKEFPQRFQELSESCGLRVDRLRIQSMKSRWGSCTGSQSISLNSRLIAAPTEVLNSVIYHELTHLLHSNHSQRFWNQLKKFDPCLDSSKAWIDQHSEKVLFFP